jgi:hypothetical protein
MSCAFGSRSPARRLHAGRASSPAGSSTSACIYSRGHGRPSDRESGAQRRVAPSYSAHRSSGSTSRHPAAAARIERQAVAESSNAAPRGPAAFGRHGDLQVVDDHLARSAPGSGRPIGDVLVEHRPRSPSVPSQRPRGGWCRLNTCRPAGRRRTACSGGLGPGPGPAAPSVPSPDAVLDQPQALRARSAPSAPPPAWRTASATRHARTFIAPREEPGRRRPSHQNRTIPMPDRNMN